MNRFCVATFTTYLLISSLSASPSAQADVPTHLPISSPSDTRPSSASSPLKLYNPSNLNIRLDDKPQKTYRQPSLSLLNRYRWQLVEVQDIEGRLLHQEVIPLSLDILPNRLKFDDGCYHYHLAFLNHGTGDYPYSADWLRSPKVSSSCSLTHSESDSQLQQRVFQDLTTTFIKNHYGQPFYRDFGIQWLPHISSELTNTSELPPLEDLPQNAYLAMNIQSPLFEQDNLRLVWQGELKPSHITKVTTPVTTELLERFSWRLLQAQDANQQIIDVLSYANIPITASFRTHLNPDDPLSTPISQVSFSSQCNGVGGDYILTPDTSLLIGYAPQTLMGCSPKREEAEDKLRELMHFSTSHLRVSPSLTNTNQDDTKSPLKYILEQTFDTGEHLVWESIEK